MSRDKKGKFDELNKKADEIFDPKRPIEPLEFRAWAIKVLNLLGGEMGRESVYYQEFEKLYQQTFKDPSSPSKTSMSHARAVFQAAKDDYEDGVHYHRS
jgi:hypothetical protein